MVVTALAVGTDTVTATSEGKAGISVITVVPVPVASVTVSPSSASIVVGDSVQLNATPKDSQGHTLPNPVTWASASPTKATVSTTGWVKGVAPGPNVTITATSGGQHGTASVSVIADLAVSVTVTPPNPTITQGSTTQMTATAKDASNATLTGHGVTWSSSKPSVASVDQNSGVVTALDSGSTIISAKVDTATGSTTLTVNLVPVDSVHLTASPDSAITVPGGTVTVTAQAFDAGSHQLSGRAYSWTSSDPTIATVTATGSTVTVTPSGTPGNNGTVTITVTCDGTQNTVIITVSGQ